MRMLSLCACCLATAALAVAQTPDQDEIKRRMDELNQRAATRPSTDRPLPRPAEKKEIETITLKRPVANPDAPVWVRSWVAEMPESRRSSIRIVYGVLVSHNKDYLKALNSLERAQNRSVRRRSGGSGEDPADAARKRAEIREAQKEVETTAKNVRRMRETIRNVQTDQTGLFLGRLTLAIDMMGKIEGAKVKQVVGPNKMLAEHAGKDIMIVGISSAGVVDDAVLDLSDQVFRVSGTESFRTVAGGTRTVFTVEPADPVPFVHMEEYAMTRDELERELEDVCGSRVPQPNDPLPMPTSRTPAGQRR